MATLFYNGLAFLSLYLASVFISSFVLKAGLAVSQRRSRLTTLDLKHKIIIVIPGLNIIVSFIYFTFALAFNY